MVRHSLTALLAAICVFAAVAARAQTTNAGTPTASDECITIGYVGAQIAIGRPGPKRIDLEFDGGGACGGYTSPSGFSASGSDARLEIRGDSCPAFNAQADKLRPSPQRALRRRSLRDHRLPAGVRAGPFTIRDFAGYFELQSPNGRRAAARWVRQMLAAVRPCWKWDDTDDDAPRFVHRLYAEIATKPQ